MKISILNPCSKCIIKMLCSEECKKKKRINSIIEWFTSIHGTHTCVVILFSTIWILILLKIIPKS